MHPCPVEALRAKGRVNIKKLLGVLSEVPYTPPFFERLVLYTPQFCKVPFKGQSLGAPRPEFEEKGYTVGELFRAAGYTLVDIDFKDEVDTVGLWLKLIDRLGEGRIIYPTRRGLHIFVKGDFQFNSFDVKLFGYRARVEIKPCIASTCTSFYRTLNAFNIGGKVVAVNASLVLIADESFEEVKYRIFHPEALEPEEVESLLGVSLGREERASHKVGKGGRVTVLGKVFDYLGSATDTRRVLNSYKLALSALAPIDANELLGALDTVWRRGGLPPCLEPVVTGEHHNNRFATIVLLVASLTKAGFGLPRGDWSKLCDLLVSRWGGSLAQCKAKLKSILACTDEVCGYSYGSSFLAKVAHLWSCDNRRCPLGDCPGPRKPWMVAKYLGNYLRRTLTEVLLRENI